MIATPYAYIVSAQNIAGSTNITYYFPFGMGSLDFFNFTTEANAAFTYRFSGQINNLYCTVISNNTAATTVKLRKNSADGNQNITIGSSQTGDFFDRTNTDTFIAGDTLDYQVIIGSGGATFQMSGITSILRPDANNSQVKYSYNGGANGYTQNSATRYAAFSGPGNVESTEDNAKSRIKVTATLKNLCVIVNSNARTSTTTVGTRINTSNGTQSVSITSGVTGTFEDTSNTDSVVSGNDVKYYVTNGAGSSESIQLCISDDILNTSNPKYHTFAGGTSFGTSPSAGSTNYLPIGGTAAFNTSEAVYDFQLNRGITLSNLIILVTTNSDTASTLRTRIAASNGNNVVTVTASTTGYFEDTTNVDFIGSSNKINLSLVVGTGGSFTFKTIGAILQDYVVGPFPIHFGV